MDVSRNILVCVLVIIMGFQLYFGLVQIVGSSRTVSALKSLALENTRKSFCGNYFTVGDTLRLVAASDFADAYRFRIYGNSSVVFEGSGSFNGSTAEACVRLVPPTFGVGQYSVAFDARVDNLPLLGVEFSDSGTALLEVGSSETRLKVNATYDTTFRCLTIYGNLTRPDNTSVVGENVDFKIQFVDRQRLTNGWLPLGSAVTDSTGVATLKHAFKMYNGTYLIMGCHAGNGNYGMSKDVFSIEISSFSGFSENMNPGFVESLSKQRGDSAESGGFVDFSVSSLSPYADLRMYATAKYVVDHPLEGCVCMFYFLTDDADYIMTLCCTSDIVCGWDGSLYTYESFMSWAPSVVGTWHYSGYDRHCES